MTQLEELARLGVATIHEASQKKALLYDKSGEEHFNIISALHKSLRNSDVDASLYWLARMLEAGEDPLYIARRLVRFASEDVGLAEPGALVQAVAAKEAYRFIGIPEGKLALAQAVVYLALAPKSNALYLAYGKASEDALSASSSLITQSQISGGTATLAISSRTSASTYSSRIYGCEQSFFTRFVQRR